eukprot:1673567-Lingulodinium_polyedra.AAC.1
MPTDAPSHGYAAGRGTMGRSPAAPPLPTVAPSGGYAAGRGTVCRPLAKHGISRGALSTDAPLSGRAGG